jgi:RNA polymerase sigma-70 factor, ECF subfamily
MPPVPSDTDNLLARTVQGDAAARDQLLGRHRERLRRMVAWRLGRQLSARVDPSDVVQEVLAEADQKLRDYLRDRPLAFYPWLRQIAEDRLIELHRRHVEARRRSVSREERLPLPEESAWELARRLFARGSTPSARLRRSESRERIQAALARLSERDRELLILRHLEQMSVRDIAAVLGATEGAVKVRHVRALQRLRAFLGNDLEEDVP